MGYRAYRSQSPPEPALLATHLVLAAAQFRHARTKAPAAWLCAMVSAGEAMLLPAALLGDS